jgi:hypothetical protein
VRSLVEARIRAAIEEGKLSQLPGEGKPLPRDVADDLPSDARFEVLLARSVGGVPEEVQLLREIEQLSQQPDDDTTRRAIAERRLRLSMLHEANGRNLSAVKVLEVK